MSTIFFALWDTLKLYNNVSHFDLESPDLDDELTGWFG